MIKKLKTVLKNTKKKILFELKFIFTRPSYESKIFCIGYNKTGTTSMGQALMLLGYNNSSFNKKIFRKYYRQKNYYKILRYATRFDSFDDLPWLLEDIIPIVDSVFPESKFIYLERDEKAWISSYKNWTYKMTGEYPDLEKGLNNFRNHHDFVLNYFKNRPDDILVLDVTDDDAFNKLANFLDKPIPNQKLPHLNKT